MSGMTSPLCIHQWQSELGDLTSEDGTVQYIKVCKECQGFVPLCNAGEAVVLPTQGLGGGTTLPEKVNQEWIQKYSCPNEGLGYVHVPWVQMPPDYDAGLEEIAVYFEDEDVPGTFELLEFQG